MKKIIIVLILSILFAGCAQEVPVQEQSPADIGKLSNSDIMDECNSLCNINKEEYCAEARFISVNGTDVSGTCRAFSRKGNIAGFEKCEGFCTEYGKGVFCEVNGEKDDNCDGII